MLVHLAHWITRRNRPAVEALDRYGCSVGADRFNCGLGRHHLEDTARLERFEVRHRWKKLLARLPGPFRIDVDLELHVRRHLIPGFLWVVGDDEPKENARDARLRGILARRAPSIVKCLPRKVTVSPSHSRRMIARPSFARAPRAEWAIPSPWNSSVR